MATITLRAAPAFTVTAPPGPVRCGQCGSKRLTPAGRCRLCPVRVSLTPAGAAALARATHPEPAAAGCDGTGPDGCRCDDCIPF